MPTASASSTSSKAATTSPSRAASPPSSGPGSENPFLAIGAGLAAPAGALASTAEAIDGCLSFEAAVSSCYGTAIDVAFPALESLTDHAAASLPAYYECLQDQVSQSACSGGDWPDIAACSDVLYSGGPNPLLKACIGFSHAYESCSQRFDPSYEITSTGACEDLLGKFNVAEFECMTADLQSGGCAWDWEPGACLGLPDDETFVVDGVVVTPAELACQIRNFSVAACDGEAPPSEADLFWCDKHEDSQKSTAFNLCWAAGSASGDCKLAQEFCTDLYYGGGGLYGSAYDYLFGIYKRLGTTDGVLTTLSELACEDYFVALSGCIGTPVTEQAAAVYCDSDVEQTESDAYWICVAHELTETACADVSAAESYCKVPADAGAEPEPDGSVDPSCGDWVYAYNACAEEAGAPPLDVDEGCPFDLEALPWGSELDACLTELYQNADCSDPSTIPTEIGMCFDLP